MNNYKRLFSYIKGRYPYFFLSLAMILVIQMLSFLSPLLVKTVLDDYLLGIEYPWVEVEAEDAYTVSYQDRYYKQNRFLDADDIIVQPAGIIIYKNGYYFTASAVEAGTRSLNGNLLTVLAKDGREYSYQVQKLDASSVLAFYQPTINKLILYILLLLGCSILVIICNYIQARASGQVYSEFTRKARTEAMRSVERLPINYFEGEPAGKTASRITRDVEGFIILYRLLTVTLSSAVLSFVFAYLGMFYLNAKLALLTLLVYPLVYVWIRLFLKYLKKIAVKVNELRSMLTAKINEIINGINILQIFNFRKETVSEYDNLNRDYIREQMREVKLHITGGWNLIGIIRGLITVFIVAYFGWQHFEIGGITVTAGLIYAYNEYLLRIVEPVNIVFNQVSQFQHAHVQIERFSKLTEGELEDNEFSVIPRYRGAIRFDNVWFAYVQRDYVLKGVSFAVEPGQLVGLVGATGSGKSSLMNLLLRFYDLTDENSGKIYVDEVDISTIPKRSYRYHIGIVLQEPVLFKGTIASNIRFGREDVSDQEIEEILISFGGEKILKKFPAGINEDVSRAGTNLSSGEKQIIALARVVVHNPSVLIMDEATAHIDTETEEMIKKALNVVCQNRTVIVIAHRLSTIYHADKIIVLDQGLKVEEGTHQELIKQNGVYANIYRAQIANNE